MDNLNIATNKEDVNFEFDKLTWLTCKEAAFYLRKTANAIRCMGYKGQIHPRKFHRRLYFRKVELDRLLESSPR